MNTKAYKRDCLLGAVSAALMFVGDFCLSIVPASPDDNGLFAREAYLSGGYEPWRLQALLFTGIIGMALAFFTVRAIYTQILPQYRKIRAAVLIGGVIYVASAGIIHFMVGSYADWTSKLAPILGKEKTLSLIQTQYDSVMPALLIGYAGMFLLILGSAFAVLTKKTILPRYMFFFHQIFWQILLVIIPDIRQLCGAEVSTIDFVFSQSSGNVALFICMLANSIWAIRNLRTSEDKK